MIIAATVALGWTLLGLSLIDLKTYRLPDGGTLSLTLVGLTLAAAGLTGPIWSHAAGAAAGFFGLAAIAAAYRYFRGIDGLGLGDAKLLAAAGAWVGIAALASVLLIGAVGGLIVGAIVGLRRGSLHRQLAIPLGPPLALGFWITWLYGPIAPP